MIKEAKALVRIIALWIIFLGSLYFSFLAIGNFVTVTVTFISGGYNTYYNSYTSFYTTNCSIRPEYPTNPDITISATELAKYRADQQAYDKVTQELCEQDQQKQKEVAQKTEDTQEQLDRSNGRSAVARETILLIVSLVIAFVSIREIRKIEQV